MNVSTVKGRAEKMAGKLVIKVVKIKGECPVYNVGDRIMLDEEYKLNLNGGGTVIFEIEFLERK